MRNASRSSVDSISNLPCNVLDRILGCLRLKDAVKTSVLSKDWRYKWVRIQELKFDYKFFKSLADDEEANAIIYRVLLLHNGPLLKFKFEGANLTPDINHWILFLSKKNVQEFTLLICSGNRYHLPSHLFTFQQLRHLEIYQCKFRPPPSFKGFEKLINLDFENVSFVPALFMNLICGCPLLERLRLVECKGFDTLEIDAANLKCFEFKGKSKSVCFKNAPMLGKATVHLDSPDEANASPASSNLIKFVYHLPSLQELDLAGCRWEYFTPGSVPDNPLTALNNVKALSIRTMSFRNVEAVSGVVHLIASCPKLQDLTVEFESGNNVVGPVLEFLRSQSFSYGAVKLLQRLHMNIFCGHEMEMEFVRFLLASAPVLEEIFIWNYAFLLVRPGVQLMDEMKQFRRASPNVKFIIEEA